MKPMMTMEEIDALMARVHEFIERESDGQVKLGKYEIWNAWGITTMKPEGGIRAFHKWHKAQAKKAALTQPPGKERKDG